MSSRRKPRQQYGALPWRRTPSGLEVLLVTSRRTGRWIIPKGWPISRLAPHEAAFQEAYEEAGIVAGDVDSKSIGHFTYFKKNKRGAERQCRVDVFMLEVKLEAAEWPESKKRKRQWFAIADAIAAVTEPELKTLLKSFADRAVT